MTFINRDMFRKILLPVIVIAFTYGCRDTWLDRMWMNNVAYEDSIEENALRLARLQDICDSLDREMASLRALAKAIDEKDYITSIDSAWENGKTVGYLISFKHNTPIRIFHGRDGKDGHPGSDGQDGFDGYDGVAPSIGMTPAPGGRYCWTINGKVILDDTGKPIYVDGEDAVTPRFKSENGTWFVSYDDGNSWNQTGNSEGNRGDSMFKDVIIADTEVRFILSDGSEFTLPRFVKLTIDFDMDAEESGIEAGRSIQIRYALNYATSSTAVTVASDGNYKAKVVKDTPTTGTILITSPRHYEDGHVTVIVTDGSGYTFSRVINFYERKVSFPNGLNYVVAAQGGTVNIPLTTNFEYDLEFLDPVSREWLDFKTTTRAATKNYNISLDVKMNMSFKERTAELGLFARNEPDNALRKIVITQSPATFRLSQDRFLLDASGKTFTVPIKSTSGLSIVTDCADWIEVSQSSGNNIDYQISFSVDPNSSGVRRASTLELFSADGTVKLGDISVTQVAGGEESPDNLIFKVRANYANGFMVQLPLGGNVDCTIDWGDGSDPERITSGMPKHSYPSVVSDYIVKISGKVTSLSSSGISHPAITEVIQWGYTGLTRMDNAFANNALLEKIPGDVSGAFSEVTSFTSAFSDCIKLKSLPENLLTFCTNITSLSYTFNNCTSLENVPEKLLHNAKVLARVDGLFEGCSALSVIPDELFATNCEFTSFSSVFSHTAIKTIPRGLLRNCKKIESFTRSFYYCSSLVSIPDDLFSYCPDANHFWQTFCRCYNLKELPANSFDNNRKIKMFQEVFIFCRIEGESPYTIINGRKIHMYERYLEPDYFAGITNTHSYNRSYTSNKFTDNDNIPINWKN